MKPGRVFGLLLFGALLVLAISVPRLVEGGGATEAPTTSLDARVDDLHNGFGMKGTPIVECATDPVPNRSFEDNNNSTFTYIQLAQPYGFQGTIINVPVVEAGGTPRIGRFGWKDQHASLKSFSGDAYLNEMGITNPFDGNGGTQENNSLGQSVAGFDTVPDPEDNGNDVDAFANFMRATRAPGRGPITDAVQRGEVLFTTVQCSVCHTPTITTAYEGTIIN